MNVDELISEYCRCDMSYTVGRAADYASFLRIHQEKVEKLPYIRFDISWTVVEFMPKDREETTLLLQTFGGDWNKTTNEYQTDKINYEQQIGRYSVKIISEPPPSCQIVEVEEHVPAFIRKVRKIVCPKSEEITKEEKKEE